MLGELRYHTVGVGERLADLAKRYYDDPRKIEPIWDANRWQIADPNQLHIGQQLLIPHQGYFS